MVYISIKPLSVNQAYKGRHFPTPALKAYKENLLWVLPIIRGKDGYAINIPKKGKIKVKYEFGVSSKNADGDNLIKVFQDCLSEKYGFNDKMIYKWEVKKVDVKKGGEYIKFDVEALE